MINKLISLYKRLKITTKIFIFLLLVFCIISAILWLPAIPHNKEAADFRETAFKQINDLRSNNILGYIPNNNPNLMENFLKTNADKELFIFILHNLKPFRMNHPYPISGCTIKTNSLDPRLEIEVEISVMNDDVFPFISIWFKTGRYLYPYLHGTSDELKNLFADKRSEILSLYNSYNSINK